MSAVAARVPGDRDGYQSPEDVKRGIVKRFDRYRWGGMETASQYRIDRQGEYGRSPPLSCRLPGISHQRGFLPPHRSTSDAAGTARDVHGLLYEGVDEAVMDGLDRPRSEAQTDAGRTDEPSEVVELRPRSPEPLAP